LVPNNLATSAPALDSYGFASSARSPRIILDRSWGVILSRILAVGAILLARLLGLSSYGQYTLSLIIPTLLVSLSDAGMNFALVKPSLIDRSHLTESAFDVRSGSRVFRLSKEGFSWAMLDHLTQIEEYHVVTESSRLTESVRHEDYRVVRFEREKLPLYVACRYRIQSRSRLVAQKNLRSDRKRLAKQSLCCCPAESFEAGSVRRFLTSFHR
jgi:hypothetical protein